MGRFFFKIADSWALSLLGGVVGGPMLWVALKPLLDGDDTTAWSLKAIGMAATVLIGGLLARDNTKGVKGLAAMFKPKK